MPGKIANFKSVFTPGVQAPQDTIHAVEGQKMATPVTVKTLMKSDNILMLEIFRPKGMRHFGFAAGPHICIGQHLARLEMSRALNGVLDYLPNLRLDPSKPAPQSHGTMMRTPHHLHVLFDPS